MEAFSLPVEPSVSLVLPIRDESDAIDACLSSLIGQQYPRDRLEIIVVDGESSDDTLKRVTAWMSRDERISLLTNPARTMTPGLNRGIRRSTGAVVGVVTGHSVLPPDYVSNCVDTLRRTGAWAVGGRIVRIASGPQGRANGAATSSPFGVGNARHNYGTRAGWAEAVFPGMWPRQVFHRIGLFDPEMVANEDNEFSHRIRRAGGGIWFEPSIEVGYRPRSTLTGLFIQYRSYGAGKVRVFIRHPSAMRLRHLVPPTWVATAIGASVASVVYPRARLPTVCLFLAYGSVIAFGALRAARPTASPWRVAASLIVLHSAYGIGMWSAVIREFVRRTIRSRPGDS